MCWVERSVYGAILVSAVRAGGLFCRVATYVGEGLEELGLLVCARWHLRWCDPVRALSLFH